MKNMQYKRIQAIILSGVLTAAMVVGMAGCANNKDSAAASTEVSAESTVTAAENSTEAAEGATEASTEMAESANEGATEGAEADTESGTVKNKDSLSGARKRRTLPHKEVTSAEEASIAASENPNAVEENYPASVEDIVLLDHYKGDTVAFKVLKDVAETTVTAEDDSYPDSQEDMEQILNGLMDYWSQGSMDSVDYLIRMGKYEYLSQMLNGSNDYFYVGEENENEEPDGVGLAVYAENAYYYGEFVDGKRSGKGFWYQIFVKDGPYSKANNGIIGHSYNGEWANDLPNGEGQEHLDIDITYLKDRVITNVKTTFVDGYYNGAIVATSMHTGEGQINWTGEARYGKMVVIDGEFAQNKDGEKEIRVLENVEDANNYYWMLLSENCGQGITGLID